MHSQLCNREHHPSPALSSCPTATLCPSALTLPPLPQHLAPTIVLLSWWPGGKEATYSVGDTGDVGSIPGSGRSPGGGHGNPLHYSFLGNPMDRSLAGYSPWGRKESDTT